jgi:hypothetical protein
MSGIKFCGQTLVCTPIKYTLACSKKEYQKVLQGIGYEDWRKEAFTPNETTACVHTFTSDSGQTIKIVCIDHQATKDWPIEEAYAVLVHEAVHIWQDTRVQLNEAQPSSEFEAYSLQNICAELFYLYSNFAKEQQSP